MLGWRSGAGLPDASGRQDARPLSRRIILSLVQSGWRPGVPWRVRRRAARRVEQGHAVRGVRWSRAAHSARMINYRHHPWRPTRSSRPMQQLDQNHVQKRRPPHERMNSEGDVRPLPVETHFISLLQARAPFALQHLTSFHFTTAGLAGTRNG